MTLRRYPNSSVCVYEGERVFLLVLKAALASPADGQAAFRAFLRTEFSEENLEFWLACEEYKKIKSQSKMVAKAKKICAEYITIQSCKEVSKVLVWWSGERRCVSGKSGPWDLGWSVRTLP